LDELKRAYLDSLQSKEDQILQLKQQVSDLKTLVMILEKENSRIHGGE
jgi:regulator of replication initiation timing